MFKKHKRLLTREEARESIRAQGLSVRKWAEKNGLKHPIVFEVLGGRKKGLYGDAYKAAVLLGLKEGFVE